MAKQFKDLYKVGDFVIYHNLICIVVGCSDKTRKSYFYDEYVHGYKVTPILNQHLLTRELIFNDGDIVCKATDGRILEAMVSLVETSLEIGDIDVYISDTNIMLCQDEGYMSMSPKQALKLRGVIDNYVEDTYGN